MIFSDSITRSLLKFNRIGIKKKNCLYLFILIILLIQNIILCYYYNQYTFIESINFSKINYILFVFVYSLYIPEKILNQS